MIKEIKKPRVFIYENDDNISIVEFNKWYDSEVQPLISMLEGAVEVYGDSDSNHWYTTDCFYKGDTAKHYPMKGYVINTRPIKKETAEDVLRDFLRHERESIEKYGDYCEGSYLPDLIERAKRALGE